MPLAAIRVENYKTANAKKPALNQTSALPKNSAAAAKVGTG